MHTVDKRTGERLGTVTLPGSTNTAPHSFTAWSLSFFPWWQARTGLHGGRGVRITGVHRL